LWYGTGGRLLCGDANQCGKCGESTDEQFGGGGNCDAPTAVVDKLKKKMKKRKKFFFWKNYFAFIFLLFLYN
jgi:hypothetical protein